MRRFTAVVACLVAMLGTGESFAQGLTLPWEKGSLQLGGFISTTSTDVRVDSATLGVGAVVNLEDALGIDSNLSSFRADALYRLGSTRRHQIEFHYYGSKRDGSKVINQTFQIGDNVFPIGAQVNSEFGLQFYNLDYSYAFFQDDRARIAVAGGVHVTGVKLKVESPGNALVEEESFTAPLPVIGLRGEFILTPRWRVKGSLDLFYLEFDNFKGGLSDAMVAVEYLPFKNVGFGLGLNNVRYSLSADTEDSLGLDFTGKVSFNFTGVLMYVKVFF